MMTYMIKFCIFTAATILLSGLRKFILVIPPPLERSTELKGRCHESDFFNGINTYVRKVHQEGVHLLRVLSAIRSVSPVFVVTP
jgi:hypothetical protein